MIGFGDFKIVYYRILCFRGRDVKSVFRFSWGIPQMVAIVPRAGITVMATLVFVWIVQRPWILIWRGWQGLKGQKKTPGVYIVVI